MRRKSTFVVLGIVGLIFIAVLFLVVTQRKPSAQPTTPTVAVLGPARTQPQVSILGQTAFLIAPDGSLWWWGDSLPGFGVNQLTPKRIDEGPDWVRVNAGSRYGVAIKADGSLWAIGELPVFSTGMSRGTGRILEVMPGTKWRQAIAGLMHVLALRENGTLWAWGNNSMGELGVGTTTNAYPAALTAPATSWSAAATFFVPAAQLRITQVGTDTNWTAIAAGMMTSLAIKSDGSLWHWGAINHVQTGQKNYSMVPQTAPVQLGTNLDWRAFDPSVIALKHDRSRWLYTSWPSSPVKLLQLFSPNGDWVTQVGGWPTGWGIKRDGTLWSWNGGGMGVAPSAPRQFDRRSDWQGIWVDSFSQARVGLTSDGQLWTWGTTLGAPLQPKKGPSVLIARLVAKVRGSRFDAPRMYPSTREPWVIMRFETNTAVATLGTN